MVDLLIAVNNVGVTDASWKNLTRGLSTFLSTLNIGPQGTLVSLWEMDMGGFQGRDINADPSQTAASVASKVASLPHQYCMYIPGRVGHVTQ